MNLFKSIKKETRKFAVEEKLYLVNIVYEKRKNCRVSITKKGINIKIANILSKKEKEIQIATFLKWVSKTIVEKGNLFINNQKSFKNKDVLKLFDTNITVQIENTINKRVSGKINSDKIILQIPENLNDELRNKYISKIISRLIVKFYLQKIKKKLIGFNEQFNFGTINNVRLKNNSSNWGSCSSKNNINISIRLLLAPEWVVDYVLIHELSHLKHRNHSVNFWNEVEKAYPNYKNAEIWLKNNSSKCII